ncbi:MAG: hypothetical protein ACYTXY_11685 [Nostoc sp.]
MSVKLNETQGKVFVLGDRLRPTAGDRSKWLFKDKTSLALGSTTFFLHPRGDRRFNP